MSQQAFPVSAPMTQDNTVCPHRIHCIVRSHRMYCMYVYYSTTENEPTCQLHAAPLATQTQYDTAPCIPAITPGIQWGRPSCKLQTHTFWPRTNPCFQLWVSCCVFWQSCWSLTHLPTSGWIRCSLVQRERLIISTLGARHYNHWNKILLSLLQLQFFIVDEKVLMLCLWAGWQSINIRLYTQRSWFPNHQLWCSKLPFFYYIKKYLFFLLGIIAQ